MKEIEDPTSTVMSSQRSRAWVLCRVVSVAISFVLLLSSYYGIKFMQSSINAQQGLGTASLAVVYASVLFSSLILANPLVESIGPKYCLSFAMLGYMSYIAFNAYPSFYTLIPASVVVGLSSAPLWASLAKYNMQLAGLYSAVPGAGKSLEASSALVFGLFYAISNTSYVWGNLISYLTLRTDSQQTNRTSIANFSAELRCGSKFCPGDLGPGSRIVRPTEERLHIMIGCFLASSAAAALIVTFLVPSLDSVAKPQPPAPSSSRTASAPSVLAKLSRTARQLIRPQQLLMTPQLINVGLSQSFAQGEFTQAFVACTQGVAFVGFVMMCYGGSQILSSLLFGKVAELFNKQTCVYIATAVQLTLDLFLLFWSIDEWAIAPLFLSSIAGGMVDAVWNSQLLALQGELFPDDQIAAFASYKVWESLGYIVGFSYSTALCTRHKLMVMIGLLTVSAVCFTVHNLWRRRQIKLNKVVPK